MHIKIIYIYITPPHHFVGTYIPYCPTCRTNCQVEKEANQRAEQLLVRTGKLIICFERPGAQCHEHMIYMVLVLTPRLSVQLLNTTWQQSELQCEGDLAKLTEWCQQFEIFASKQDSECLNPKLFAGLSNQICIVELFKLLFRILMVADHVFTIRTIHPLQRHPWTTSTSMTGSTKAVWWWTNFCPRNIS